MAKILETERLILRQFELTDAKFIVELVNSPEWLEFIGDRNIRTEIDATDYIKNSPMKSYEQFGFGLSMVQLKNGTPVGMCGILKRSFLDHPDIGFAFLPQFMEKGYAFEIASATMHHARKKLNMKTILAVTLPKNHRSIRLLEKIGFKFRRTIFVSSENEELMLYISNK
jgi:RimJ/RimL family protein N-acetyltransferase